MTPHAMASENSTDHQPVTVSLSGHDLKPPVYVAGTFTSPPWTPEEMEVSPTRGANGEPVFSRIFQLAPGQYHYKFRLGDGEWWICDESSTMVRDEAGNSNNQLTVSPLEDTRDSTTSEQPTVNLPEHDESIPTPSIAAPPIIQTNDAAQPKDLPVLDTEGLLGTWNPNEEISPSHRRASTSLGVRISRIGTFLPPEPSPDLSKDSQVEAFPSDRKDILTRIETLKTELPEDDSSHLEKTLSKEPTDRPLRNGSVSSVSGSESDKIAEYQSPTSASLDGNLDDTTPVPTASSSVYSLTPGTNQSYGTLFTNKIAKDLTDERAAHSSAISESTKLDPASGAVRRPPKSNGSIKDNPRDSASLSDDVSREKETPEEQPRGFTLFVMIASWLSQFWNWLFKRPKRDNDQAPTAQIEL